MPGCVRPKSFLSGFSVLIIGAVLTLTGCATTDELPMGDNGGRYKVGAPYQIKGVWYYPKEEPGYDETGIASWYGDYFHGRKTANGEIYNMNSLTAAHRTLPLPSFVDVTNLENGKQIRLRVNDRGPYARGRIIDVSKRAAELLGFKDQGVARVRVTFAGPVKGVGRTSQAPVSAAPLAAVSVQSLPGAGSTTPAKEIKTASLGPAIPLGEGGADPLEGEVRQVAVPAMTQIWIQTGAFERRDNANRQAQQLRAAGAVAVAEARPSGRTVYRVRLGPIADVETADSKLDQVIGMGFNGAQVIVD
jgi:rare lipoprotein A